jgi:hypothetical protein
MFAFSLFVKAERGGLRSFKGFLLRLLKAKNIECIFNISTGLISQNNTAQWLLPLLNPFDINFPFGEYHVIIGKKTFSEKTQV